MCKAQEAGGQRTTHSMYGEHESVMTGSVPTVYNCILHSYKWLRDASNESYHIARIAFCFHPMSHHASVLCYLGLEHLFQLWWSPERSSAMTYPAQCSSYWTTSQPFKLQNTQNTNWWWNMFTPLDLWTGRTKTDCSITCPRNWEPCIHIHKTTWQTKIHKVLLNAWLAAMT